MRSLVILFALHAALRFPGDDLLSAVIASVALLGCMMLVARFAGWQSLSAVIGWLKSSPGLAFLVIGGTLCIAIPGLVRSDLLPLNHVLAYAIEAFFFGLAFVATLRAFFRSGVSAIQSWFRQ